MTEQSKTPRTDANLLKFTISSKEYCSEQLVSAKFARELESENADLRRQVEEIRKSHSKLNAEVNQLTVDKGLLEERAEQAEAKLAAAQAENADLRRQVEEVTAWWKDREQKVVALIKESLDARRRAERAETKLTAYREKYGELE